jgi:hypothetical protein
MVINYSITPKNLKFGKRYPLLYIDKISLGFRKINPRKYIETKELLWPVHLEESGSALSHGMEHDLFYLTIQRIIHAEQHESNKFKRKQGSE